MSSSLAANSSPSARKVVTKVFLWGGGERPICCASLLLCAESAALGLYEMENKVKLFTY